jgi:hypothetical protein
MLREIGVTAPKPAQLKDCQFGRSEHRSKRKRAFINLTMSYWLS